MPIKKHVNQLRVQKRDADEMISFVTGSKKSHFKVSEARLCEHLQWVTQTTGGFFVTYVSLVPTVAVHVHGNADILAKHAEWLESQITATLTDLHDDGRDKVR